MMDIESLVIRLEQLSKIKDVDLYLSFRDTGMADELLFADDNTMEYERIEAELKNALIEEINVRSLHIFNNLNLRDFNLLEIERQLGQLGHPHWQSRNPIEIKRDRLLNWQYHYYDYHYKRVEKYKQLQDIDAERKAFKEKLEKEIINYFEKLFIEELELNKLQELLRSQHNYYYSFIKERANEHYETRSEEIKERDTFGYIDVKIYENCLRVSLEQAIAVIQSTSKEETVQLYLNFLRTKLAENNFEEYSGSVDNDLYDYASNLFDSRTHSKITDDNSKLIELKTYLKWRHSAIENIQKEYPTIFAEDEYEDDFEDYGDYERFDSYNSRYEKYGGYNGYDDDTIDDAFEGDPSNTWNVD